MVAKIIKKRLLVIVSTVVLVGIVVVGCYFLFNKDKVTYIQFNENIPFEYTKAQIDVKPTKKFTYNVDYDPTTLKGFNLGHSYSDAIAVYCEPSLSIKAQDAFVNYQNGKFIIAPYSDGLKVHDNISKDSVSLSKTGEWGFSDEYFIVQKLDPKTGSPLKKPLVTRFTVKNKVAKPVVSFSVDDKGIGHFSWMPIENASKYYIITMQEGTPGKIGGAHV